jgi:hypothetical protein
MVTTQRLSVEERMKEFDLLMRAHGYRPPVKEDLVPGAEMLMVEVERYMEDQTIGPQITGTKIKLDDEPVKPSNADPNKLVVFYHCMVPFWEGDCFVGLDDFTATGYRKGCYANDHRWVVKAR